MGPPPHQDQNQESTTITPTIKSSIDELSKKWNIEKPIYDLHLGRRTDVVDTTVKVNQVIFHIPHLSNDDSLCSMELFMA